MGPVHVLINNAGIMFGGRKETEEVSKEAKIKVYFKAQKVPKNRNLNA